MYSRLISGPGIIVGLLKGPTRSFVPREDLPPETPPVPDPRRTAGTMLIVTVLLVLGGVLLVHALNRTATLQDCVMSGRTNCAPIAPSSGE